MICTKRTIQRQLLSLSKTGLSRGEKITLERAQLHSGEETK